MKLKLYTVTFFILLLLSCLSDDNSSIDANIKPPTWIQGTWYLEESSNISGFRFTNNDFCGISFNAQSCFKQQVELVLNAGNPANVGDEITNDFSSIIITILFATTV